MAQSIVLIAVLTIIFHNGLASDVEGELPNPIDISRIEGARYSFTYNGHTYEVSNLPETWYAAKFYCKWLGMELVSIETKGEQLGIYYHLRNVTDSELWTALNDDFSEGTYFWESTGAKAESYLNWDEAEPSSGATVNCVYLSGDNERKWRVADCENDRRRYMCETRSCK